MKKTVDKYSTSQLAKAVGLHPNTIRLYESWGWLGKAIRQKNGYRQFAHKHLLQLRLLQQLFRGGMGNRQLRANARKIVSLVAKDELHKAKDLLQVRESMVRREKRQAEEAVAVIEGGERQADFDGHLSIKKVAEKLDVSHDTLYTWERNGLLKVPKDEDNGYRRYGPFEIERLLLIRLLRQVGYSISAILRLAHHWDGRAELFRPQGVSDIRTALDTPYAHEAEVPMAADRWLSWLSEEGRRCKRAARLLNELTRL